jgi:hypothetical protein
MTSRLLERRRAGTPHTAFAHELLSSFHDACRRVGLDGLLAGLEQAVPGVDASDRTTFFDGPLTTAVVAQFEQIDLDDGSPRNAKPRQLLTALTSALGLEIVDEPDPTITLDGAVRSAAAAAITQVIEAELASPQLRDAIIAHGRIRCDEAFIGAYTKMTAQLDERGMKLVKQLKLPVDAVHAVERVLFEARAAVLGAAAGKAIDRAKEVIAKANPEAAARIDAPITLRLTPRDVAIARVTDPRSVKIPAVISASLLESLAELAYFKWTASEAVARPYSATQKFAVGDRIDHPKFGVGSVIASDTKRVDVEFTDGKVTLVHGK